MLINYTYIYNHVIVILLLLLLLLLLTIVEVFQIHVYWLQDPRNYSNNKRSIEEWRGIIILYCCCCCCCCYCCCIIEAENEDLTKIVTHKGNQSDGRS